MAATKQAQRRSAAEEVCWALMLMVNLGGLDGMDLDWRKYLADPLLSWCDLAVATGELKP